MSLNELTITPSVLMHASLAQLSPELRTLNTIIRLRSKGTLEVNVASTSILSVPSEILLIIRDHLLPLLTSQLIATSSNALIAYESSRLSLLCPDCQAHYTQVYGPDIWSWPTSSGPCHCADIGRVPSLGRGASIQRPLPNPSKSPLCTGSQNPKQFTSPQHWLETYLSKHAKRLLAARYGPRASMGKGIWDLVSDILCELECDVVRDDGTPLSPLAEAPICGSGSSMLAIVPAGTAGANEADIEWRTATILNRAQKELALQHNYADIGKNQVRSISPVKVAMPTPARTLSHGQPSILASLVAFGAIILIVAHL